MSLAAPAVEYAGMGVRIDGWSWGVYIWHVSHWDEYILFSAFLVVMNIMLMKPRVRFVNLNTFCIYFCNDFLVTCGGEVKLPLSTSSARNTLSALPKTSIYSTIQNSHDT